MDDVMLTLKVIDTIFDFNIIYDNTITYSWLQTVNIPNAYEDLKFDSSVDDDTGFRHRTILCMPIKNSLGQIVGVIQLVNKFDDLVFTKNDENFVEAFAIFCGMGIHNTHM